MDTEAFYKMLSLFAVGGLCTVIVFCAMALPGLASALSEENNSKKTYAYFVMTIMIAFIILSALAICFLFKYRRT